MSVTVQAEGHAHRVAGRLFPWLPSSRLYPVFLLPFLVPGNLGVAFRSPAALPRSMALRPLKWILANQFQHARSFIGPSLEHESVPPGLRERVELRIRAGKRLLLLRVILVVVLFVGVGVLTSVVADWISGPAARFLQVLTILVPVLAAPAILLVTRSIKLLETDIHILAAEVVARCHAAEGPMPSGHAVVLRKRRK